MGQSPPTAAQGINAQVLEVASVDQARSLGSRAKGKIIFFNGGFDPTLVNSFAAYGKAGEQRFVGPAVAAKLGAVGALVRSMSSEVDDVPHTGVTEFAEGQPQVPAAALSLVAADLLSKTLKANPRSSVKLKLSCHSLPDVASADVVGELTGQEKPGEVVLMGGHLDSWDKGRGAHDDGAGVVQSLEALRLMKDLGWRPMRTIRVVLWMDEEQKGSGASAYLKWAKSSSEVTCAAIESDSGGFAPRGFGTSLKGERLATFQKLIPFFRGLEVDRFDSNGEVGADIGPLGALHSDLFGLEVESQRYFDYHHSEKDTLDKVNPRELELGAIAMALLSWYLANR